MRRRPPLKARYPIDTAFAWTTLGLKWMEMMAASGQVIARRSARVNTPAMWVTMGGEKLEAAMHSSTAMTRQMMGARYFDAFSPWDAWPRLLLAGVAPYHSRATRNARR